MQWPLESDPNKTLDWPLMLDEECTTNVCMTTNGLEIHTLMFALIRTMIAGDSEAT